MRDPYFEYFIKKFGEADSRVDVSEETIASWQGKLPAYLLEIWRQEGWGCYGNGRFWLVNPADYEDIKDAWLDGTSLAEIDTFHVIARDAFGDLELCGERTGASVTISSNSLAILALKSNLRPASESDLGGTVQALFAVRTPEDCDVHDVNDRLLFDQALQKHGRLAVDEIYGFEPALAVGGQPRIENIRRVKLDPYLLILPEFDQPTLDLM